MKFVDPRGKVGEQLTVYGDPMYDWAKVYQSLCGYDHILQGRKPTSYLKKIRRHFEQRMGPEVMEMLPALTSSLLFSLIPLHNSTHQKEFFQLAETVCESSF